MLNTFEEVPVIRQQKNQDFSFRDQKSRDARIRAAWLAIPSSLHSRPEPRGPWDQAARTDCPYSPWERMIDPMRSALRAAVRTRDPQKVKAVAIRIEAFFEELHADVIAVIPLREEASMLRVAIEETEAQGRADIHVQELIGSPVLSVDVLEKAEQSLARHESAIRRFRTIVGSLLRNGVVPVPMRIHR